MEVRNGLMPPRRLDATPSKRNQSGIAAKTISMASQCNGHAIKCRDVKVPHPARPIDRCISINRHLGHLMPTARIE
jgi:hypothetical protein